MGVRRQAREAAIQALFMCDFLSSWSDETVEKCFEHFGVVKGTHKFASELAKGVVANRDKIDSQITFSSENWSIARMGRVDRALLRLATFEIMFHDDIPTNVAINEAIEIAKRFGSDDSPVFINGVLDKIASLSSGMKVEVISTKEKEELVEPAIEAALPFTAVSEDA